MPYRGLVNFRDAGGHVTEDGGRMATGLLYRSGRLEVANPADAAQVAELGIELVVDLRSASERDRAGTAELYVWQPQIRELHVPYFASLGQRPAARAALDRAWTPTELARRYIAGTVDQGRFALARLVEVLADSSDGAALIHCWSGKDRTGLSSAVIQSLVGVPDRLIAADYAATGDWFARHLPDHPELQSAGTPEAYALAPETMLLTLEGLRAQFGSITQMLVESGASDIAIDRLRQKYRT